MKKKPISPQQRVSLLPFEPEVIHSDFDNPSIRLEDYRWLPPSDLDMPPMNYHILALHYKPPVGLLRHRCGGQWSEATMSVNDITYVPAMHDNQWQFDGENPNCFHVLLEDSYLSSLALASFDIDIAHHNFIDSFQIRNTYLQKLTELLRLELTNRGKHGSVFTESLVIALAIYLITHFSDQPLSEQQSPSSLSKSQFDQTLSFMQDQLEEKVSITEMAQNLHLSPYHFSRMFRRRTGMSPYQYLTEIRLRKAKVLLATSSSRSLASIAQCVGFADQSHFGHQFRKRFGMSPGKYRNSQK